MATKSTYVAPNTIEIVIKTVHPSTLSTIAKIGKGIGNLQLRDGIGSVLIV
jgi:hypothetical protein